MSKFDRLYQELQKKIFESEQQILELKIQVQNLILENIELKKENAFLKEENGKLKDRLGINSKNSSIPSSKELYKIKRDNKKKSNRKIGGQVGHKGYSRKEVEVDEIVKLDLISRICECGGEIGILSKTHIHQKIDIPEIKPLVTEYHIQRGRCKKCGKRKKSDLPAGVTGDLFGARVKTIIGALTGFYKNSKREVESILKDIFNLQISVGSVSNNESRIAEKCKEAYEDIELNLSYADLLHIDETSHYNKGKLGWCWLFSSSMASLIKLEQSRGMKVLEESVFGSCDNVIVTDSYADYNYFDEGNRQNCLSHISRDFERFAHSSNLTVKANGEYLVQLVQEIFGLKNALLEKRIDILRFIRRARKLRKRIWYYLKNIRYVDGAKHASGIAKNIMKSENMMWKFLDDPMNIPLTNNHAERQIRHYVTYRKNSYFTQSERGNRFLERIISLYLTWKQNNLNPVRNLQNLLIA